jgi:hypothetical protein
MQLLDYIYNVSSCRRASSHELINDLLHYSNKR